MCSEARVKLLEEKLKQREHPESACRLTALQSTANQILDDMEDKEIIPNRYVTKWSHTCYNPRRCQQLLVSRRGP